MHVCRILAFGATALALSTLSSRAGPCTYDIEVLQNRLRVVEQSPTAPESRSATLHRQPTAQSIAAAEQNVRQLYDTKAAALALARAREADNADNAAACTRALNDVRRALAVRPDAPIGGAAGGK